MAGTEIARVVSEMSRIVARMVLATAEVFWATPLPLVSVLGASTTAPLLITACWIDSEATS
jgi:hypothetical protein